MAFPMPNSMNVLIADDHPLYREALVSVLDELGPPINVLQAGAYDEVMEQISDAGVDLHLVLLDLYMGIGDWSTIIQRLRLLRPETPVIVISGSDSRKDAERAMRAGAYGYIPKSMKKDEILSAIRLIVTSGVCIQPRGLVLEAAQPDAMAAPKAEIGNRIAALTARQRDVLAEIGAGKSNKLIARSLGMTEGTVKLHVAAILKCLGMANRTQAAIAAHHLSSINQMSGDG